VLTRDGRFYAPMGSPGGNAIPSYVLKSLVAVLNWRMSMQDAASLPNLVARGAMGDVPRNVEIGWERRCPP
jgi:gamma-glutamyltranspeptidase/glutathione hydrolase